MRIISKYHDYYDCCQDGSDKEHTWVREQKEIKCEHKYSHKYCIKNFQCYLSCVGFCGKLYVVIEKNDGCSNIKYFYDWNKFYDGLTNSEKRCCYSYNKKPVVKNFEKDWKRYLERKSYLNEYFKKYNCPYFYYYRDLTINPVLKNLEFYKVFSTQQAIQEIEMFLYNDLGISNKRSSKYKGKEIIPDINDKDMIIAKGFDKHSFRNMK